LKEGEGMADVQLENGYTRIANELLEAVLKTPFTATHLKIIMVCWRYLYGFNRKQAELSEGFISKEIGISRRHTSAELKALIDAKVLCVVRESTYTTPRILSFNKDYDEWRYGTTVPQVKRGSTVEPQFNTPIEPQFNTLESGNESKNPGNIDEISNSEDRYGTTVPQVKRGSTVEPEVIHIKKVIKNIKKEHEEFFESIWKLYPEKKGKAQVREKQKEKLFSIGFEQINRCIERYKESKPEWKAWQHGSTFFNSGYIDYLDENYEAPEAQKYTDVKR
jgi:phage replication O-like protein O